MANLVVLELLFLESENPGENAFPSTYSTHLAAPGNLDLAAAFRWFHQTRRDDKRYCAGSMAASSMSSLSLLGSGCQKASVLLPSFA
jgi:hypothetical protein